MRLGLGDFLRSREQEPAAPAEEAKGASGAAGELRSVPLEHIRPNPYQPRQSFDEESIAELAESIAEQGLLQPLVVRPAGNGYQLLLGERRFRACQRLGMTEVPAIVRTADDREAAVLALVENMQREDLSLFEEVEGLRFLAEHFQMSQQEIADSLGLSQSSVANKLRLLKLAPAVREVVTRENLTERHARALLAFSDPEKQLRAAQYIAEKRMNVREAEEWIARQLEGEQPRKPRQRVRAIYKDARLFLNSVRSLVTQLEKAGVGVELDEEQTPDYLEVRVRIRTGKGVE